MSYETTISMLEDELHDIKVRMSEDYSNGRRVRESLQVYTLSLELEILDLRKKLNKTNGENINE